jgi:hypothetical protein
MKIRILASRYGQVYHLSNASFGDSKDNPACGVKMTRNPAIYQCESNDLHPIFVCSRCMSVHTNIGFSQKITEPVQIVVQADRLPGSLPDDSAIDNLVNVSATIVAILPDTSRFARAVVDVELGPIQLIGCLILGDVTVHPQTYSLGMPGKRAGKSNRSKWQPAVICNDDALSNLMERAAIDQYIVALDSTIERISQRLSESIIEE